MVIHEYFNRPKRRKIALLNEEPPDEASPYLERYDLCKFTPEDLLNSVKLADVAAVVFRQRERNPNRISRELEKYAEFLLWHDCRIFVEVARISQADHTQTMLREFIVRSFERTKLPEFGFNISELDMLSEMDLGERKYSPLVRICDFQKVWENVADDLLNYPPGESPNVQLDIEVTNENSESIELTDEQRVLVQRAFHDCATVKLLENSDGRSGVSTYRVYADRRKDLVSKSPPYEYFIKIGGRRKISKEYLAYRDIALEHIPFHLGPRLRLDRCALGAKQGILVCDYVSGAEKLLSCACDGRAVPIIASLFNTTLRSWQEGFREVCEPMERYLSKRMPSDIPSDTLERIESIKRPIQPNELLGILNGMNSTPVLVGVSHGDLHALNVLVRGGDAIVIDFEKLEMNVPLLLDLASLEAGFFVDGFIGYRRSTAELLASVKGLYETKVLIDHRFEPCDPRSASAWFFDCVRQVRLQARPIERKKGQYALALAVELARKACKKLSVCEQHQGLSWMEVRAVAYVLAEIVLVGLDNYFAKE